MAASSSKRAHLDTATLAGVVDHGGSQEGADRRAAHAPKKASRPAPSGRVKVARYRAGRHQVWCLGGTVAVLRCARAYRVVIIVVDR